jgi:hypothetical protein
MRPQQQVRRRDTYGPLVGGRRAPIDSSTQGHQERSVKEFYLSLVGAFLGTALALWSIGPSRFFMTVFGMHF